MRENITGVKFFCAYQQVVSTSSFILYPLFIFTSSLFAPKFPFFASTTNIVRCSPRTRAGIRNINTASPPQPLTSPLVSAKASSPTTVLPSDAYIFEPYCSPPNKYLPSPPNFVQIVVQQLPCQMMTCQSWYYIISASINLF